MAESTLSLNLDAIRSAVGHFLGFGRTASAWSTKKLAAIDAAIATGHRQFYVPPPVGGRMHRWSFLEPRDTIVTVAGTSTYDLPEAFGHLVGTLTFGANEAYRPLRTTGENRIREYLQADASNGIPQAAAVRWKASDGVAGQRQELVLWPTPDAVYNLTYKYAVLPNALTAVKPWPLGGMGYAETILASCLAAAELQEMGARGERYAYFLERLASSIALDRENDPECLGQNLDAGQMDPLACRRHDSNSTFTYTGAP